MKFTISEVFCEIVSAIGFIAAFIPILVLLNWVSLVDVADWVTSLKGANLLSFAFISYILGVVLNVVGLPADKFMKRLKITGQYPGESSRKLFYQKASSDLFNFRTNAWNHYYCFRNLLTFSPFAFILWGWVIYLHWGFWTSVVFAIVFIAIVRILYLAVREHADVYSDVTRSFD